VSASPPPFDGGVGCGGDSGGVAGCLGGSGVGSAGWGQGPTHHPHRRSGASPCWMAQARPQRDPPWEGIPALEAPRRPRRTSPAVLQPLFYSEWAASLVFPPRGFSSDDIFQLGLGLGSDDR